MGGQPEQARWALAHHPRQTAEAHGVGPLLAGDSAYRVGAATSPCCGPEPSLGSFPSPQLLCLIGEMFDEYSDEVCGAVINIRAKGDKIAIWTREAENREGVTHIG